MKTRISNALGLLLIGLLLGCGGDFKVVPVSGTVTMDGEPAAGVKVAFSPRPLENNPSPGPFSTAITDENGGFSLKTRYGNTGAIVGPHLVSFRYVNGIELTGKLAMAESQMAEATLAGDAAAAAKAKKEYQKLKASMSEDKAMPARYGARVGIEFAVPKGGDDAVKFELTSDE